MLKWHDLNLTKIADTDGNTATDNSGNPYFRAGNIPISNGSYVWTQDSRMLGHVRNNVGGYVPTASGIPLMSGVDDEQNLPYVTCDKYRLANGGIYTIGSMSNVTVGKNNYIGLVVGEKTSWATSAWNAGNENYNSNYGAPNIRAVNLKTGKTINIDLGFSEWSTVYVTDMAVADNGDLLTCVFVSSDLNYKSHIYLIRNETVYWEKIFKGSVVTRPIWAHLRSDGSAQIVTDWDYTTSGNSSTEKKEIPNISDADLMYGELTVRQTDINNIPNFSWIANDLIEGKKHNVTDLKKALSKGPVSFSDIAQVITTSHATSNQPTYLLDTADNSMTKVVDNERISWSEQSDIRIVNDDKKEYGLLILGDESDLDTLVFIVKSSRFISNNVYELDGYGVMLPNGGYNKLHSLEYVKGDRYNNHASYGILKLEIGETRTGKPVYADFDTSKYLTHEKCVNFFGIESELGYEKLAATTIGNTKYVCTKKGLYKIVGENVILLDKLCRAQYNFRLKYLNDYSHITRWKKFTL